MPDLKAKQQPRRKRNNRLEEAQKVLPTKNSWWLQLSKRQKLACYGRRDLRSHRYQNDQEILTRYAGAKAGSFRKARILLATSRDAKNVKKKGRVAALP